MCRARSTAWRWKPFTKPFTQPERRHFLGGLIAHARAATAFTTPTVNGYKRYRSYSLVPDRAIWGRDNRGVMVRVQPESSEVTPWEQKEYLDLF